MAITRLNNNSITSITALPSAVASTPAFETYISSDQNISNNSFTKVTFNTEQFDTDSCYDNSTNYRFTPTVAGKYYVYASLVLNVGDYVGYAFQLNIRRNGGDYVVGRTTTNNSVMLETTIHAEAVISFNGSTDYVEVFGFTERHGGADVQKFVAANKRSIFGAFRIIGA